METGEENIMKRFVTFEGIDGSGKSSVSKEVYQQLQSSGYDAMLTFEPTDSTIGKYVQECIKTNADPFVTSFAFLADRMQHSKQIQEWLSHGKIVLCDRYAESTYAYQGAQLASHLNNPIQWLQDLSKDRIIIPERTFLFVIDPKISLARIQHRSELIPFEQASFLQKVHENYLSLATEKRFKKLDATQSIEELAHLCYQDIVSH